MSRRSVRVAKVQRVATTQRLVGVRRIVPAMLAPVVLLGRGLRRVMFGLFAAAERIDPFAWAANALRRLQPLWSWIQSKLEPFIDAIHAAFGWLGGLIARLTGWIGRGLALVAHRLRPIAKRVWFHARRFANSLARLFRPAWDLVRRAARSAWSVLRRWIRPIAEATTRLRLQIRDAADQLAAMGRSSD